MQIQVNTSNGIDNKEALERWADTEIQQQLQRFRDDVTRVEVHLSDENHEKAGERDKCCVMEARLAHHQPLAVKQHASSMDEASRRGRQAQAPARQHAGPAAQPPRPRIDPPRRRHGAGGRIAFSFDARGAKAPAGPAGAVAAPPRARRWG